MSMRNSSGAHMIFWQCGVKHISKYVHHPYQPWIWCCHIGARTPLSLTFMLSVAAWEPGDFVSGGVFSGNCSSCRFVVSHLHICHQNMTVLSRERLLTADTHTETETKATAGAPICGTKTATSAKQHCWHITAGGEVEKVCNKRCKWGVIVTIELFNCAFTNNPPFFIFFFCHQF